MTLVLTTYEDHAALSINAESEFEKRLLSYVDSLKVITVSVSVQHADWNSDRIETAAVRISFSNTANREPVDFPAEGHQPQEPKP